MGFYSFIVVAPGEVPLPDYLVYLDTGRNVFNATVNDLDAFKQCLSDEGVQILQVNRLDEFEPVDPTDLERDPFDDDPPLLGSR